MRVAFSALVILRASASAFALSASALAWSASALACAIFERTVRTPTMPPMIVTSPPPNIRVAISLNQFIAQVQIGSLVYY